MFPALQDYCAYCLVRGCDEGIVISPKALAELYDAAPQLGHTHTAMARFIVDTIVWYDVDIELLVNPTPRLLKAVISQLQARGNRRLMNPFLDVRNWYVGVKEDDMKEMVTDTYGVGKIGTPEWERMQDTAGLP